MSKVEYHVLSDGPLWKVRFKGREYPRRTRQEALKMAIDAAYDAGKSGSAAEVLVQSHNGKFRTEWTFGRDPYPPWPTPSA